MFINSQILSPKNVQILMSSKITICKNITALKAPKIVPFCYCFQLIFYDTVTKIVSFYPSHKVRKAYRLFFESAYLET